MKRVALVLLAGLLVLGIPAMAEGTDPNGLDYENYYDGDNEVGLTVNVAQIGELWTSLGMSDETTLTITNLDGTIREGHKAQDTVSSFANVPYNVKVALEGSIPIYSRFHVVVKPAVDNYNDIDARVNSIKPGAEKIITWDRRPGGYITSSQPNREFAQTGRANSYLAFTGDYTYLPVQTRVDYVVDAIHGMPDDTIENVTLVWTIEAQ